MKNLGKVTVLTQRADLVRKVNIDQNYYSFDRKSWSNLAGQYILIQYYKKDIKTKYGEGRYLVIATDIDQSQAAKISKDPTLAEEIDLNSKKNWKIYSSSKRINSALDTLYQADEDCFPLLVKIIKKTIVAKREGQLKEFTCFELDF